MKHKLNKTVIKLKVFLVLSLIFMSVSTAQTINGPTTVASNSTQTYSLVGGYYLYTSWEITGGGELSTTKSRNPHTYTVTVQWGASGTGEVVFKSGSTIVATLNNIAITGSGGGTPVNTAISDENFVHTIAPLVETTDITSLDNEDKIESVTYYDGLGRAKQSNAIRAGGNYEDIVTYVAYDHFGRMKKEYLPYAESNNGGAFLSNALSATQSFYNTPKYEDTSNPFTEKYFEASPLNRVLKQAAPGNDWAMGQDHEVETNYLTNNSTDAIKRFEVTLTYNTTNKIYDSELNDNGTYSAEQLFKTVIKDENHLATSSGKKNTVEEYKDAEGRIILKRTYATVNNAVEKHDTYYVYDVHGNLTYVLPPEMNASSALLQDIDLAMDGLGYQYKYGRKNRLLEKKVPGKGWEYIIYNLLDQPVMTQDANLRAQNKWLVTKYDVFGRVVYTGVKTHSWTRVLFQNYLNDATVPQHETKTSTNGYLSTKYTNVSRPYDLNEVHTINYYDNYSFITAGLTLPSTVDGQAVINYNNTSTKLTKSLATGSKVRVLGVSSAQWITTITGYDVKGRPIIVKSDNSYLETTDAVESTLDFTGNVVKSTTTHSKTNQSTIITVDNFEYDHMNRLKSQTQTIGSNTEVIVENNYDELGQLESKGVGGGVGSQRLQDVNYTYNVRGWLLGINNENRSKSTITLGSEDLFGFQLNYNDATDTTKELFNGNVAQTLWTSTSVNPGSNPNPVSSMYTYTYDELNRLIGAKDNTGNYNLGGFDTSGNLIEPITYDKNGNILSLIRIGQRVDNSSTFGTIDNLTYDYYDNSNRLRSVEDGNGSDFDKGFKNGITALDEYIYDDNGNMVKDLNKDIIGAGITNGILYNHLNLPTHVYIDNGDIEYIYDATGIKLQKIVTISGTIDKTVTYAGNYIYEKPNGSAEVLKYFSQPEGFVEKNGSNYKYVYQYTDHLGNIRLNYNNIGTASSPNLEIQEENNYYPFGLKHKGYNGNIISENKYQKFNGVELEEFLGLNLYEMPFRQYDPAIVRWTSIDPVTHHSQSTYNGYDNNPVFWADPSGADVEQIDGGWKFTGQDAIDVFNFFKNSSEDNDEDVPNDIIFLNNEGDELGRIVLPGDDTYVQVNTDNKLISPFKIEPKPDADAVGFNGEASVAVGGGMHYGIGFVYFLNGDNKNELFSYEFFGGQVGLGAGVGFAPFFSYFNEGKADPSKFNVDGFGGKYNGYSASFIVEGSYTWSNERNTSDELFPNHRYTRTWKTIGATLSLGAQADIRFMGGESFNFARINLD